MLQGESTPLHLFRSLADPPPFARRSVANVRSLLYRSQLFVADPFSPLQRGTSVAPVLKRRVGMERQRRGVGPEVEVERAGGGGSRGPSVSYRFQLLIVK